MVQIPSNQKKMLLFIEPILQLQVTNVTFTTLGSGFKAAEAYGSGIDMSGNVRALCKQGRLREALNVLQAMEQRGIRAESSAYASLLQGCAYLKALPEGRLIHTHMVDAGLQPDLCLGTKLVIMYAKCGSLADARQVLDEMPKRNVVAWTAMIAAYARHGHDEEALALFRQMQMTGIQPDQYTFASVLPACANLGALEHGKELHEGIIRSGFQSNAFVGNALIDMYVKCRSLEDARQVFDKMSERDVVSWTAMITGYAQNGHVDEALKLFWKMPGWNVVSWTAMIAAYARQGHDEKALALFHQMKLARIRPNQFTFATVLSACANTAALERGKEVHEDIIRGGFLSDIFVRNALVDMYAKCGSIEDARNVFDNMPERDTVSWTVMIAGYAQNGHVDDAIVLFQKMPKQSVASWTAMIAAYAKRGYDEKALTLFNQMQRIGIKPNQFTFASVLPACANLAALEHGKEIHEDIIRNGFHSHNLVANALVDMYAKCGSIENARKVFDKMFERDVVSWNALIGGYAMHGCGNEALQLFEQMQHSGMKPNRVTFIGVLSACCHSGLVDDGWQYFDRMIKDYHITPAVEHYCCMVDLLGRAGHLDEAHEFIEKMPIEPDAAVWGSLLGACRIHTNVELGECVAERLFELDPKKAGHYVLLSNIYAAGGKWDGVEKVRQMMKDRRVKKNPGCSWIEVNNKVYGFLVGERSHPQMQQIYSKLERLSAQMKEAGYVPNINFVLHDVE